MTAHLKKSNSKFSDKFKKDVTETKKVFSQSSKGGTNGFAAKQKERYDRAPGWMKKNPQDGPETMKHEGNTFNWCAHHKLWQKYKMEDRQLRKHQEANRRSDLTRNPQH